MNTPRYKSMIDLKVVLLLVTTPCLFVQFTAAQSKETRRRTPAHPTSLAQSLQKDAAEVAERYWKKRVVRCGKRFLWAVRDSDTQTANTVTPAPRPATRNDVAPSIKSPVTPKTRAFFFSESAPVITTNGQSVAPIASNKNQAAGVEWSGKSSIHVRLAQVYCEKCSEENSWKKNFGYTIGIRKVDAAWETFYDPTASQQVISEPLFDDLLSERGLLLSACLELGGDPNALNEAGDSLLMTAAKLGHNDAVLELLYRGVNINLKHRNGWTASYVARLQNHMNVAAALDRVGGRCEGPLISICSKMPPPTDSSVMIRPEVPRRTDNSAMMIPDPMLAAPPADIVTTRDLRRSDPPGLKKVRILSKPDADYTPAARQAQVTGTVVLRALFLPSGEITKIRVVSGLPYGLSEKAVEAAKKIKFFPAMLDGQPVARDVQVEYNFNLY